MNRSIKLKQSLIKHLRPDHLIDTISNISEEALILDVGCGSKSPVKLKSFFPKIHLHGIDIWPISEKAIASLDSFRLSTSREFHEDILDFQGTFDLLISHHNLEHCVDRQAVLHSMCNKVSSNGLLFFCFPSSHSLQLPRRKGTLNYFDDPTHTGNPPDFNEILDFLKTKHFEIICMHEKYQPIVMRIIGAFLEPVSRLLRAVLPGTWSFHGFESLIIARKLK